MAAPMKAIPLVLWVGVSNLAQLEQLIVRKLYKLQGSKKTFYQLWTNRGL